MDTIAGSLFLFVGLFLTGGSLVGGLKSKVFVPPAVVRGKDAVLHCDYDLERENLYTQKWYKNNDEFYRFTLLEKPQIKTFPIDPSSASAPAPDVDVTRSNATHLYLVNVQRNQSATYVCEVSADKPSFLTAKKGAKMEVVEIPDSPPELTGLPSRSLVGDKIRANCTSRPSYPPANLSMAVNGKQPVGERVRNYHVPTDRNGLQPSVMTLEFEVKSEYFKNNESMKVLCRASIYSVYWQTTEKAVEEERTKLHIPTTLETGKPPRGTWPDLDGRGSDDTNENNRLRSKRPNGSDYNKPSQRDHRGNSRREGNADGGSSRNQPLPVFVTTMIGTFSIVRVFFPPMTTGLPSLR